MRRAVADAIIELSYAATFASTRKKASSTASVSDLQAEVRSEHVKCWRDVVLVMRDFLLAREAHEQAKGRAIFINHVGTGTEGYL